MPTNGRPIQATIRDGFFILRKVLGFGFFMPGTERAADRGPAVAVGKSYAVRFDWKLWKSLRLALCIASAASVSDWI